jgi:hypothetical protein
MNSSAYRFYSGALILPRRVTKWMRIVAAHRLINSAQVRCLLADRGNAVRAIERFDLDWIKTLAAGQLGRPLGSA